MGRTWCHSHGGHGPNGGHGGRRKDSKEQSHPPVGPEQQLARTEGCHQDALRIRTATRKKMHPKTIRSTEAIGILERSIRVTIIGWPEGLMGSWWIIIRCDQQRLRRSCFHNGSEMRWTPTLQLRWADGTGRSCVHVGKHEVKLHAAWCL